VGLLHCVRVLVSAEETAEEAVVLFLGAGIVEAIGLASGEPEGTLFGAFVRLLFPLVHLLLERPRFFFIGEGQANYAVLGLEGMEKGSVLVVDESIEYLLVPDNASVGRLDTISTCPLAVHSGTYTYVNQLYPKSMSDQVVGQHGSSLKPRISPSRRIRVSNIQPGDSYGQNLVGGFGNGAFDDQLVFISENRRHGRQRFAIDNGWAELYPWLEQGHVG